MMRLTAIAASVAAFSGQAARLSSEFTKAIPEPAAVVGDPHMTVGFEVEWHPSTVGVRYEDVSQVFDHKVLFHTDEINFQLETQSNEVATNRVSILEAVSRPFGTDQKSIDALHAALDHVAEFTKNAENIIFKLKAEPGKAKHVRWPIAKIATFATLAENISSVYLRLGKGEKLRSARICPQVTVSYALENVHNVFAHGYMPQECSPSSKHRTPKMQDCATQAATVADLVLYPKKASLCPPFVTKILTGKWKNCTHPNALEVTDKEELRLRSFFTMLAQNLRAVVEKNVPFTESNACRGVVDGRCVTRKEAGEYVKDQFGLISKTPLHLVFNSLDLNTKQQVYQQRESVMKFFFTALKEDYDALRQMWKDESVAELEDFLETDVAASIGLFRLAPDRKKSPTILEYLDYVMDDGRLTVMDRLEVAFEHAQLEGSLEEDVKEKKKVAIRNWGTVIGDGTATPIIFHPEGSGLRPAFEYRQLLGSMSCLKTVIGRAHGHADGSRVDGR